MKIAVCTICNTNSLPKAQSLFQSLKLHFFTSDFFLVFSERPELKSTLKEVQYLQQVNILSPNEIGAEKWLQMAFSYTPIEFDSSLKPFLLRHLFQKDYDAVIYLDEGNRFNSILNRIDKLFENCGAVVTPFISKPFEMNSSIQISEEDIVRRGQLDFTFLALKKGPEVMAYLNWWADTLANKCILEIEGEYRLDPFWGQLLISFVPSVKVIRDDLNSSLHQDLIQRQLALPSNEKMSSFSRFNDGAIINNADRRKYLYLSPVQKESLGDPFDAKAAIQSIQTLIGKKVHLEQICKELMLVRSQIDSQSKSYHALKIEFDSMIADPSWKVGRAITWPLRQVKALLSRG